MPTTTYIVTYGAGTEAEDTLTANTLEEAETLAFEAREMLRGELAEGGWDATEYLWHRIENREED